MEQLHRQTVREDGATTRNWTEWQWQDPEYVIISMADYWLNYTYESVQYYENSGVALVRFSASKPSLPAFGIVKCSPITTESRREALVHQMLSFKNLHVVNQYHVFTQQGQIYEVMDYASRGSLETYINSLSAPLSREEYLTLICRLLIAVQSLHEANCSHGNLRPSNFVLMEDGSIKLIDFGKTRKMKEIDAPQEDDPSRITKFSSRPTRHYSEDVWRLGFTCFWCGCRDTSLVSKPPSGHNWLLDKYVESKLSPIYDSPTVWIVRQMLNLNEGERGSLDYIRSVLAEFGVVQSSPIVLGPGTNCGYCHTEIPDDSYSVQLPCGDIICYDCFGESITNSIKSSRSIANLKCPKCGEGIDYNVIIRNVNVLSDDAKLIVYNCIQQTFETVCPREGCGGHVKTYKMSKKLTTKPYTATCPICNSEFCSVCKAKDGHMLNGYKQKCVDFDPNFLRNLIAP